MSSLSLIPQLRKDSFSLLISVELTKIRLKKPAKSLKNPQASKEKIRLPRSMKRILKASMMQMS